MQKLKLRMNRKSIAVAAVFILSLTTYMSQWLTVLRKNENEKFTSYFLTPEHSKYISNIVETHICRIPNITLEDDPASQWLLQSNTWWTNCSANSPRWTYTNGSVLILNTKAVLQSGFKMDKIICCYRIISKAEQTWQYYNRSADQRTWMSPGCFPLNEGPNDLNVEFIRVHCVNTTEYISSVSLGDYKHSVYTAHHAIVNPRKNAKIQSKIGRWSHKKADKHRPPNVIIIGIDSMSRQNFHRTMKSTAQVLRQMGALELLGYTKVGVNTYPNAVPFLSGLSTDELRSICCSDPKKYPQDTCPYIWKRFDACGYLTAHVEDHPYLNIFNYLKVGFLKDHVDFVVRPLMLKMYEWHRPRRVCFGPDTIDEKALRYMRRLIDTANANGIPLFLFSWMTSLGHGDINNPRTADKLYANFLRELNLENTILFFMGDHGMRFGAIRRTIQGWYEDKLPNFWLYIPPHLRRSRPDWLRNLRANSRRLSTPFDMYHTMVQMLNELVGNCAQEPRPVPRYGGQSLLKEIPVNRSCKDARITNEFCPCRLPVRIPVNHTMVAPAVEAAISRINGKLPEQCAKLSLGEIRAAAKLDSHPQEKIELEQGFVVAFTAEPGDFWFEATVTYSNVNRTYVADEQILRMNRISRRVRCVRDSGLEGYCYCLN